MCRQSLPPRRAALLLGQCLLFSYPFTLTPLQKKLFVWRLAPHACKFAPAYKLLPHPHIPYRFLCHCSARARQSGGCAEFIRESSTVPASSGATTFFQFSLRFSVDRDPPKPTSYIWTDSTPESHMTLEEPSRRHVAHTLMRHGTLPHSAPLSSSACSTARQETNRCKN